MKIDLFGAVKPFEQVDSGALIRIDVQGTEWTAIKCVFNRQPVIVTLTDPSALSIKAWESMSTAPCFVYADAQVRVQLECLILRSSAVTAVGDILIADDGRSLLQIAHPGGLLCVDVSSGLITREPGPFLALYRTWSIQRLVDGKPESIFSWTGKPQGTE